MSPLPSIVPISDLRQDAAGIIKRVVATDEPVVITQRGRASAVLVSRCSTSGSSCLTSASPTSWFDLAGARVTRDDATQPAWTGPWRTVAVLARRAPSVAYSVTSAWKTAA
jgi:prevent-host-death family protein